MGDLGRKYVFVQLFVISVLYFVICKLEGSVGFSKETDHSYRCIKAGR